jgi:hypothetical protein
MLRNDNVLRLEGVLLDFATDFNWKFIELWEVGRFPNTRMYLWKLAVVLFFGERVKKMGSCLYYQDFRPLLQLAVVNRGSEVTSLLLEAVADIPNPKAPLACFYDDNPLPWKMPQGPKGPEELDGHKEVPMLLDHKRLMPNDIPKNEMKSRRTRGLVKNKNNFFTLFYFGNTITYNSV